MVWGVVTLPWQVDLSLQFARSIDILLYAQKAAEGGSQVQMKLRDAEKEEMCCARKANLPLFKQSMSMSL